MGVQNNLPGQYNLNNRIRNFLDRAAQPEMFVRLMMIISTTIMLLFPVMYNLVMLLSDVFDPKLDIKFGSLLFEGTVLMVVFTFAMMIITAATYGQRDLQVVMVLIALCLVIIGGGVLGRMANSCIPDRDCNTNKFVAGLVFVTMITGIGYIIPRFTRQAAGRLLGIVYLAVSVWSSELWLMVSAVNKGIEPTGGAIRALFLLIYAIIWVGIFFAMPIPEEAPPPQPNRYRR